MKIYELVEDKVYQYRGIQYKVANKELLVLVLDGVFIPSEEEYNDVLRMNFEEVVARIPDENTSVNTMVRVKNEKHELWHIGYYFGVYIPNGECRFWCFNDGDFQKVATELNCWRYCEIIEDWE